jgi:hypothetical protein
MQARYLLFTAVNLLLTIIGAIIIYLMSDRITKDLNLMAQLLLKIEKKSLFLYLDKFQKVLISLGNQQRRHTE